MGYRLVTPPATLPVSRVEAKAQLRVDHSDEDTLIDRLIAAATAYLDARTGILGRCLITQTWEIVLDAFPSGAIEIPLGLVQSVTSVAYVDTNGMPQTVSSSDYYVDTTSLSAWVVPEITWPDTLRAANVMTVRFVAGYGSAAAAVPEPIRHAILLLVGHWYEQRMPVSVGATASEMPIAVSALIAPFRVNKL